MAIIKAFKNAANLDQLGIAVSVICLLHCLTLPIVTSLLPFLYLYESFAETEWVHILLLAVILPTGFWAFSNGWKIHKHPSVAILGGSGMLLVCAGSLLPLLTDHNGTMQWLELALILPGSVFLTIAHLRNYRCRLTHSNAAHPYH